MAEETKKIKTDNGEKMVRIMIPMSQSETGDVHVSVAGADYTIQREEYVEVPWYVAEAIENSLREKTKVLKRILKMRKQ